MKKINVEVIAKGTDISKMYDVSSYKNNGLFLWEETGQLISVNGGCASCIWTDFELIKFAETDLDLVSVTEDCPDTVIESGPAMVSEDLFLKTVAIIQDANLITDLIDKGD